MKTVRIMARVIRESRSFSGKSTTDFMMEVPSSATHYQIEHEASFRIQATFPSVVSVEEVKISYPPFDDECKNLLTPELNRVVSTHRR